MFRTQFLPGEQSCLRRVCDGAPELAEGAEVKIAVVLTFLQTGLLLLAALGLCVPFVVRKLRQGCKVFFSSFGFFMHISPRYFCRTGDYSRLLRRGSGENAAPGEAYHGGSVENINAGDANPVLERQASADLSWDHQELEAPRRSGVQEDQNLYTL